MSADHELRHRHIYPYQRGIYAGKDGGIPVLPLDIRQTEHYAKGINRGLERGFLPGHDFTPDEIKDIFQPLTPATFEQYRKGHLLMSPGIARLTAEEAEALSDEEKTNRAAAVNAYKLGFLVHMVAGSIVRPEWYKIPSDDVALAVFKDGSMGKPRSLPAEKRHIPLRGDEGAYELGLETMISERGGRGIVYPIQVRHPLLLETFKLALNGKPVTSELWQELNNLLSRGDLNKLEIAVYFGGARRVTGIKRLPTKSAQVRALYSPLQELALQIRQKAEARVS